MKIVKKRKRISWFSGFLRRLTRWIPTFRVAVLPPSSGWRKGGGRTAFRNVGILTYHCTASHPRRPWFVCLMPWKPQNFTNVARFSFCIIWKKKKTTDMCLYVFHNAYHCHLSICPSNSLQKGTWHDMTWHIFQSSPTPSGASTIEIGAPDLIYLSPPGCGIDHCSCEMLCAVYVSLRTGRTLPLCWIIHSYSAI